MPKHTRKDDEKRTQDVLRRYVSKMPPEPATGSVDMYRDMRLARKIARRLRLRGKHKNRFLRLAALLLAQLGAVDDADAS